MSKLYAKIIVLPRQARDKHRGNSTKRLFFAGNPIPHDRIFSPFLANLMKRQKAGGPKGTRRTLKGAILNLARLIADDVCYPVSENGRPLFEPFMYTKTNNLPRQARDKHEESTQKRTVFCVLSGAGAVKATRPGTKTPFVRGIFILKLSSFYQDRLGTNIGKGLTTRPAFPYRRSIGTTCAAATRAPKRSRRCATR